MKKSTSPECYSNNAYWETSSLVTSSVANLLQLGNIIFMWQLCEVQSSNQQDNTSTSKSAAGDATFVHYVSTTPKIAHKRIKKGNGNTYILRKLYNMAEKCWGSHEVLFKQTFIWTYVAKVSWKHFAFTNYRAEQSRPRYQFTSNETCLW